MKTAGRRIYRTRALFSGSVSGRVRPGPGWRPVARAFEVVLAASALAGALVLAGGSAAQAAGTITYLSQFGAQGTGPGQFEAPEAVAVNSSTGVVYVSDVTNGVVEEFDSSGNYLSQLGGPGTFSNPISIAVDPGSGDVYVLDAGGQERIQGFNASGTLFVSWTLPGFPAVGAIAVDPATEDVYAIDYEDNQVAEFDSGGHQIAAFGSFGSGNGQFIQPYMMTRDTSSGDLYAADATGSCRVQQLDSSGNYLSQFGSCGTGDGQFTPLLNNAIGQEFYGPTGLAVDPVFGDVYAVDGGNNRVEVFDPAGNYLTQAGGQGGGDGQFSSPEGDAFDPGTGQLYVVDTGNDRVQVFGTSQASTTTVSASANPSVPGQSVTYTATVSPVPEEGTVAFADNGQPITACGSQPVDTSTGNATCTVSYPGTGSHQITATYSNSAGYGGSVSAALTQNVQPGATTASLTSSPNPSSPGQAVTYTATVTPVAPAAGTPTGTVSFSDGTAPIGDCTAQALSGITATCTVTYTSSGSHSVTATYGGDANFAASAPSKKVNQVVGPVPPAPVVASISPAFGPAAGGTPPYKAVTITGDNLCQATGADFGSAAAATFSVAKVTGQPGACVVRAASPPGTGVVDVTVTSPGGTSATGPQDRFSYAPVVASISPAFGPAAGGTPPYKAVTITGDNLCQATGADFGSAAAATFSVAKVTGQPGACVVRAASPPGTGVVDVTVTSPGGTSATGPQDRFSYAPVVASISPAFGPAAGGTPPYKAVTITGDNLCQATGADFGSAAAATFSVAKVTGQPGACVVRAASPPGTGVVDVTVTSPGGTSATGPQDRFSYAPVVASISPAFGPAAGGTPPYKAVTITGDNLCQATGADFGSAAAATFSVAKVTGQPGACVVRAASPPGTGVVDVTVTSPGGTSATGPQDRFSYAPVVASISPAFGPGAGGTKVTIAGDNLCQATGADFGSVAARFAVAKTSTAGVCVVLATSPPGTGVVDVTVTSPGGTSATGPQDQFSYQ